MIIMVMLFLLSNLNLPSKKTNLETACLIALGILFAVIEDICLIKFLVIRGLK
jgi:hypothetical protein